METFAAMLFEIRRLARGQTPQVADDLIAVGESVPADRLTDERPQDLLGAPTADTEGKFERSAVHPREGKPFELLDGRFELGIPDRFVGQCGTPFL